MYLLHAFLLLRLACNLPNEGRWATVSSAMGPLPIAIYRRNDIVSNNVYNWELDVSRVLFSEAVKGSTFVDVGANIGVHTLRGAALGLKVIAVEAMPLNQRLLKSTICANPTLNISVVPVAVGPRGTCELYSGNINHGDCHLVCDGNPPKSSQHVRYVYRGTTDVVPPGDFTPPSTAILKVDIEGSECNLFQHLHFAPRTIVAEATWSSSRHCIYAFSRKFNCKSRQIDGDVHLTC